MSASGTSPERPEATAARPASAPAHDGATDAQDDPPAAFPAWRLLTILMAMNVVAYLDRSILSLAAPAVQADLGLSHVELSLVLGLAFVTFYVVFGLPIGWLVDRFPRRPILASGIAFWSLSASAAGLAQSFGTLLLARLGIGAGEASLHPSAFSMITDAFPKRRLGFALTLYGGAGGLGAALSVAAGGLVLGAATAHGPFDIPLFGTLQPWQFTLILSGLPGLLLASLIFAVPEPARRGVMQKGQADASGVLGFMRKRWRFYVPVILGHAVLQIGSFAFSTWQPTWMVQRFGWDIGDVGLILSIGLFGTFIGSIFAGWMVDRLSLRWSTAPLLWATGCSLFGGSLVGLAFLVDDPWLCVGLVFVGQFPLAIIGIMSMSLQQVTPNQYRGQVSAIFILFTNLLGFGIGPFLPAALADYGFGHDGALGMGVAITCVVTAPIAAILFMLARPAMRAGLADAALWRQPGASAARPGTNPHPAAGPNNSLKDR